jgi:acetate---CoA ligase (ADP-forming)
MLEARSVAVVGASPRPGSFGQELMVQLVRGGFDGAIYPVNPNYREVLGFPCHPGIAELPEPVDLAILGVGNERLEEQLAAAAAVGAPAAVLFASCHEPPRQGVPPLAERLRRIAASAGMVLCGGNGMGFLNLERHLRACGYYQPPDLVPGGLAFLTHSGSAFSALLHNDRGLACNLAVSCGQELTTTMAAYLDYAADLPSTRVVAMFVETARDPDAFRAALAKAAARPAAPPSRWRSSPTWPAGSTGARRPWPGPPGCRCSKAPPPAWPRSPTCSPGATPWPRGSCPTRPARTASRGQGRLARQAGRGVGRR